MRSMLQGKERGLCGMMCIAYISDYDVCEGAIWMKDESRYKYE